MTRMTAFIIQSDPEVSASYYRDPKTRCFGVYIGTVDETPSGCIRPRPLLTSEAIYWTPKAAIAAGTRVIESVRKMDIFETGKEGETKHVT